MRNVITSIVTYFLYPNTRLWSPPTLCPNQPLGEIEDVAEIIPVNKENSQFSITNNVRIGSIIYNGTDISELDYDDDSYGPEKRKNETLEDICRDAALSLVFINLSEFSKSGAALSCFVMHLSRIAYPD